MAPITDEISPYFVSNSFIWQKVLDRVCSFSRKYLFSKTLCCVIETVNAALRGEWRGHIRDKSILSKHVKTQTNPLHQQQWEFYTKDRIHTKHWHSTNDANMLPMSHDSSSNGSPSYNILNSSVSVLHV